MNEDNNILPCFIQVLSPFILTSSHGIRVFRPNDPKSILNIQAFLLDFFPDLVCAEEWRQKQQISFSHISRQSEGYNNDPLFLQASDHPGMQLTGLKLNGTNFQQWSRSVKVALRTRTKLAFIDGSCKKPPPTSLNYK